MHALIVGGRGVGKSTLIHRVLAELNRPVFGFETKKEIRLEDPLRGCPIYFYDAGRPHCQTPDNLIGYHKEADAAAITAAFTRFASRLTAPVPGSCIVEMDEIGFLEAQSVPFCRAVMELLDGNRPVIAAVKDRDLPFLEAVRSHPNARCFHITPENRNELYDEVLGFLKQQLEDQP